MVNNPLMICKTSSPCTLIAKMTGVRQSALFKLPCKCFQFIIHSLYIFILHSSFFQKKKILIIHNYWTFEKKIIIYWQIIIKYSKKKKKDYHALIDNFWISKARKETLSCTIYFELLRIQKFSNSLISRDKAGDGNTPINQEWLVKSYSSDQ